MRAWASIETAAGRIYELTDNDVIWAARMVAFEGGGDYAAVLWSLTRRFGMGSWGSFKSLITAYSQPLNPAWGAGGSCCCGPGSCPAGRSFCGGPECSPQKLSRRARAKSSTWQDLERSNPRAVRTTREWATAKIENPVPKATGFAGPEVALAYIRRNPDARIVKKAGNWFIASRESLRRPDDYVIMRLGKRVAGPRSEAGSLSVMMGAAVLSYAVWRRYRS